MGAREVGGGRRGREDVGGDGGDEEGRKEEGRGK